MTLKIFNISVTVDRAEAGGGCAPCGCSTRTWIWIAGIMCLACLAMGILAACTGHEWAPWMTGVGGWMNAWGQYREHESNQVLSK
jgi:hypothetical protein